MGLFDWFTPQIPLEDAVRSGKLKHAEKALEKGVSQSELDSCLGYAIHSELAMVKLLVKHGANINSKPRVGRTPLHNAAACGYIDIVRFLIDNGAKVNVQDNKGDTPLDLAFEVRLEQGFLEIGGIPPSEDNESRNKIEIAKILKSHGGVSGHNMDPQFRARLQSRITPLVFHAKLNFPTLDMNSIVKKVDEKLNYQFPPNMPISEQRRMREEIQKMIKDAFKEM